MAHNDYLSLDLVLANICKIKDLIQDIGLRLEMCKKFKWRYWKVPWKLSLWFLAFLILLNPSCFIFYSYIFSHFQKRNFICCSAIVSARSLDGVGLCPERLLRTGQCQEMEDTRTGPSMEWGRDRDRGSPVRPLSSRLSSQSATIPPIKIQSILTKNDSGILIF